MLKFSARAAVKSGLWLTVALLLVVFVQLVATYRTNQELKSELAKLSKAPPDSNPKVAAVGRSEAELELVRLGNLSIAHAETRRGSVESNSPIAGDLPQAVAVHPAPLTPSKDSRLWIDDIVVKAKAASIEVTGSQTSRDSSQFESETITVSARGTYTDLRAWLIDVTDSDPLLLLTGVQLRRESRSQPRLSAEVRFTRIDPVGARQ